MRMPTTPAGKKKTRGPIKSRIKVRRSGVHGRGVYATAPIRKGTRIIEYTGRRLPWKKAMKLPPRKDDEPYHTFFFSLENGDVIDAAVGGNESRWINHSCDPNCVPVQDSEGRIFIKAKRTIRDGEELSYNYRLNIEGRLTKRERAGYACRCGSAKCRGTLLDDG